MNKYSFASLRQHQVKGLALGLFAMLMVLSVKYVRSAAPLDATTTTIVDSGGDVGEHTSLVDCP